jgi:PAS domain S-box-containing protein
MILVVDDDPECLAVLTGILTPAGYRVRPADSGELALASINVRLPELILLDIRMPGMSGLEVCRRLKAREESHDIPVIFLSGANESLERLEGLKLGAVDFIPKPFQHEELLARVRTHLDLSRLRRHLEQQVAQRTAELRAANELLQAELADRRHAEQGLRESEERFRELANRAPVAIWITGPDKRLLFHNKRAAIFAGCPKLQLLNHGWTAIVHPEDLEGVQTKYSAAVLARQAFRIECRVRRANGAYHWVLHTGIPHYADGAFAGYIGTSLDITDLKRRHDQMVVSQKLESLGVLTAGIAHDFNTLVGSIFAASDMALFDLPPDSPARENIERINVAATRAAEIVNLLMAYSGASTGHIDRINLSLVVAEMLELLKGTVPPYVVLDISLERDLPEVRANVTQIRQVISNLVINACESLGRREGVIRVTTERVWLDGAAVADTSEDGHGREFCRLAVSDSGCGMRSDVCARVFDPFFTTKFLGRGLGLAAVQGIVRSFGGTINVTSAPGAGSTFEILMPCMNRVRVAMAV